MDNAGRLNIHADAACREARAYGAATDCASPIWGRSGKNLRAVRLSAGVRRSGVGVVDVDILPRQVLPALPAREIAGEMDAVPAGGIQSHLEKVTASAEADVGNDVLRFYSEGRLGTRDACRRLGLRDGSELLLALAERHSPVPLPPPHVIEAQAEEFVQLWKSLA